MTSVRRRSGRRPEHRGPRLRNALSGGFKYPAIGHDYESPVSPAQKEVRQMAYREEREPVVERQQVVQEPGSSLTSYAFVKYAFILAITIVVLFFLAKFILPMFS